MPLKLIFLTEQNTYIAAIFSKVCIFFGDTPHGDVTTLFPLQT